METLESIVLAQEFFAGLDPEIGTLIAGCARNHHFEPDTYLFREGESAREFYLVRHGDVALEIHSPGRKTVVLSTMRDGEIVGASWLVPPYRWNADARALTHGARARVRCRMPARQVRRGPPHRLSAAEAFCAHHGEPAAGGPSAIA